jgi:hypothetical protein
MCCQAARRLGGGFAHAELLFFRRGTVHAMPSIKDALVVFLSVDTPRRDPRDITFVNPTNGTPETFVRAKDRWVWWVQLC